MVEWTNIFLQERTPPSGRLITNVCKRKMKISNLNLPVAVFAAMLSGCTTSEPKEKKITLAPFVDTYLWHPYHLTREAPNSTDGQFRLVGVSKEGTLELIDVPLGTHIILKRNSKVGELAASKRPMKITQFDFASQSVDFEWLTTN